MYLGRNYSLQIILDENIKKPEVKLYHSRFYITVNKRDGLVVRQKMNCCLIGDV